MNKQLKDDKWFAQNSSASKYRCFDINLDPLDSEPRAVWLHYVSHVHYPLKMRANLNESCEIVDVLFFIYILITK